MNFKKGDVVVPNEVDYTPMLLGAMGLSPQRKYEIVEAFEDRNSSAGSGYSVVVVNDRGHKWTYDQEMFQMSERKH